jgi:hypothetical protein
MSQGERRVSAAAEPHVSVALSAFGARAVQPEIERVEAEMERDRRKREGLR